MANDRVLEFVKKSLKRNPEQTFEQVGVNAKRAGHKLKPWHFAVAKRSLGLGKKPLKDKVSVDKDGTTLDPVSREALAFLLSHMTLVD